MIVREIITQADPTVTLLLPEEMIGKTVEVIAFEIDGEKSTLTRTQRLRQIEELTKSTQVDLGHFKFDRNEANNYDE